MQENLVFFLFISCPLRFVYALCPYLQADRVSVYFPYKKSTTRIKLKHLKKRHIQISSQENPTETKLTSSWFIESNKRAHPNICIFSRNIFRFTPSYSLRWQCVAHRWFWLSFDTNLTTIHVCFDRRDPFSVLRDRFVYSFFIIRFFFSPVFLFTFLSCAHTQQTLGTEQYTEACV